jgi:flagellar motor switch protein FliN
MSSDVQAILKLEVPVIVRLGERVLTVAEVVNLVPGAIIELPKRSEDELDLMVNNKQVGFGTAVKVGENFGLRITYIGDQRSRIAALGGGPEPTPPPGPLGDDNSDAIADAMLAGRA